MHLLYRAFTYAQLRMLFKKDLDELLEKYPEEAIAIKQQAKRRMQNSQKVNLKRDSKSQGSKD